MATENLHDAALTFVMRHQGEHLDSADLVGRTTRYLSETYDVSAGAAFDIAAQSWAEVSARRGGDWVDLSRSTSNCVVLRTANGRAVAFTPQLLVQAAQLLDLAGISLPEH